MSNATLLFFTNSAGTVRFLSSEHDPIQGHRLFTEDPSKAQRYTDLHKPANYQAFHRDEVTYVCAPINERDLGRLGFVPPTCSEVGAER